MRDCVVFRASGSTEQSSLENISDTVSGRELGYVSWTNGDKKVLIFHEFHDKDNSAMQQYPNVTSLCERGIDVQPDPKKNNPTERFTGEGIDIRTLFDHMDDPTLKVTAYLTILRHFAYNKDVGMQLQISTDEYQLLRQCDPMKFTTMKKILSVIAKKHPIGYYEYIQKIQQNRYAIPKGSLLETLPFGEDDYFDSFRYKNPIPMKEAVWLFESDLMDYYLWERVETLLRSENEIAVHVGHAHAVFLEHSLQMKKFVKGFVPVSAYSQN